MNAIDTRDTKRLDGKALSQKILADIAEELKTVHALQAPLPKLVVVLYGLHGEDVHATFGSRGGDGGPAAAAAGGAGVPGFGAPPTPWWQAAHAAPSSPSAAAPASSVLAVVAAALADVTPA